jgi:two-component system, NarL family, sensor kinase
MPTAETDIRLTIWLVAIFTSVLVICFLFFVLLYQRRQRNMMMKKKEMEAAFQQTLLETQIEIQEQTLTNISQELHDNIGQTLSLAKLHLNTLKWQDVEASKEKINVAKEIISQSIVNVRDIAKSMLGEKIAAIGLQQAIQNELKILQTSGKYFITFNCLNNTSNITSQQELIAFRILQEALHNIIKHADATKIEISFTQNIDQSIITLTDNGKGFDIENLQEKNTGVGLTNMRNRATLIQAEIQITSKPSFGTTFILTITA